MHPSHSTLTKLSVAAWIISGVGILVGLLFLGSATFGSDQPMFIVGAVLFGFGLAFLPTGFIVTAIAAHARTLTRPAPKVTPTPPSDQKRPPTAAQPAPRPTK